jgi:hypothetical protein
VLHFHNEGGKFLGWYTWQRAYDLSKNINNAIYSFAFLEEKPKNDILPFEIEDTFYFGMTCGLSYDKKNKTSSGKKRGGEIVTGLQKRLITHNGYLKELKDNDKKSKMFFEHFRPQNQPQKERYVGIGIPGEHMDETPMRSFVSTVESEFIFLYTKKFNKTPLLNLDEESKPRRKAGSHSMRVMSSPSLLPFIDKP